MDIFYRQFFARLPYPTGSHAGKTVIITGSNVGLGKEAARHFARLGVSRLVLAVHSLEKGRAAKEDIEATTNCGANMIQVWQLDMASASVQEFAARVDAELDRVDMFIANAGVWRAHFDVAEEDEETISVNVVSTFLLAGLVLPKLKATAAADEFSSSSTRPTFTIVSSEVHSFTTLPQRSAPDGQIFAAISDRSAPKEVWDQQYSVSKLLEVFGVRAIAEKSPASVLPVTVNCVNPGLCHSELARDYPTWGFFLMKLFLARSTEAGSRTLVHAATQGAESHGQYLSEYRVREPAPFVTSPEGKVAQDRVWSELVKKLEAIKPGVTSNF
ncbi:putative short-chain dehydrogenase [Diplogelasinospora grovesii]|uniref:Short-chain dehydrogenase n=1 Tax=Diplogelasinospora grovesii TaxID=303347 RepID=A0AAN6MXD1_9PEZI|nr:putative short-chain dehydrogenase [Diplogelasinospora grovesii]